MQYKALLAVGIALVAFQIASAQPVKRSCACGLKGIDVCSGCIGSGNGGGIIVRPSKPVRPFQPNSQRVVCHRIGGAQEFKPLGNDLCASCSGLTVVTPAIVPRIPCTCGQQRNSGSSGSSNSGSSYGCGSSGSSDNYGSYGATVNYGSSGSCGSSGSSYGSAVDDSVFNSLAYSAAPLPGSNDFDVDVESGSCGGNSGNQGPYPADAVSLALATEMAQRASKKIREENLMFGPISKPIDGTIRQQKTYVPEDALYQVKNQIVELRAPRRGITAEEEAEATLLAAQQDNEHESSCGESNSAPLLSYSDLGYAPVEGGCPTFVRGSYTPANVVTDTFEYTVPSGGESRGSSGSACSGGAYGGGLRTIGGGSGYGLGGGYGGNSGSCTCACACQSNNDLSGEADGSSEDNSGEQEESSSCGCGRY